MSKPIPDKAEVALEYPDKLYIGTFERTARFDAHLDAAGISLTLDRTGDADVRKSIHMHFHYALFAEILSDLAATVAALPIADVAHREALRDAATGLAHALGAAQPGAGPGKKTARRPGKAKDGTSDLTPAEEVALLHVLE